MTKYLTKYTRLAIALFALAALAACETVTINQKPESIGQLYGFKREQVKGGDFWITTYQKITNKSLPYVFYIEGDGAAFMGKYRVSYNPTPRRGMFIQLATMDQRPNVVYVARPCQYTPMELNPKCSNAYWTSKRLSDDSVESINEVINKINNGRPFSLVGFSGGGGIAVLVAARNPMVKDIITISANLDHKEFTKFHNVTPMIGSLNPIDYATSVNQIPQLHLSGGKDKTIPPFITDSFVQASGSSCVKQKIFESHTHNKGWDKVWEHILTLPIRCYD